MDPISEQKFDELYRQCESLSQHKYNLQSLKLKVKKLKKAGKLKLKHLPRSLTSPDQDWLSSGLSTDASPSVCDDFEPKVDDREIRDGTKIPRQEQEEFCIQQGTVASEEETEEETEEVTLLDEDVIDDTSTCRVTLSSTHRHGHQTLLSKTNRTLKRRQKKTLEQLPQSANVPNDQDKVLPLFCDPAEHFGGVWQSIVVEKDEGPN
ncbi:hypothetical protein Bbelb_034720 [Branchiostoma belcheri]|nr:hypothetical protein Bbelb_034720 [Branchiostoma belcheri]